MPKPGERPVAQSIAEQILGGETPGTMATWSMPGVVDHEGYDHAYGGHMGAAYVRGDGTVYSTVMPDS